MAKIRDGWGRVSPERFEEERSEAQACAVTERREFERVMAAGEPQRLRVAAMSLQRAEHLLGKFRHKGGIVFPGNHQAPAACSHPSLDVRHGAHGRPELTQFIDTDLGLQPLPKLLW